MRPHMQVSGLQKGHSEDFEVVSCAFDSCNKLGQIDRSLVQRTVGIPALFCLPAIKH